MQRVLTFLLVGCLAIGLAVPAIAEGHLVVLMYHRFDAGVSISIPMDNFRRQIQYLKDENYHFVTMDELVDHLENDRPFPEKSVMITVDDGFESTYTKAYPYLEEQDVPWVFYPYTQAVKDGYQSSVNWSQIREMADGGVDVENHSYSHGKFIFDEHTDTWVARELTEPHRELDRETGQESRSFAIPYGMYDRSLLRTLRTQTDYDVFFHIDPGVVDPTRHDDFLPRFGVNRHTTFEEFKQKLNRLPLAVRSTEPRRGARLSETPDTMTVTFANSDRVRRGPLNVFISEFSGPLEWSWKDDDTIVVDVPGQAQDPWNRLIVTAYDSEKGKYRYYSHGMVFEQ